MHSIPAWLWICFGILLLLGEILTPGGFYLFFAGLAALLTGVMELAFPHLSFFKLVILFIVLLTLLLTLVRKKIVEKVRQTTPQADKQEFVGETARTLEPIPAGKEGKVEVRGSVWQALNTGDADLPVNAWCTVTKRDGLRFCVAPKAAESREQAPAGGASNP